MNYLFDTNVVVYFLGKVVLPENALNQLDDICSHGQQLSAISRMELLGYKFVSNANEEATKLFIHNSHIFQISETIQDETIRLRKVIRLKLPDAIIAATALVHKCTLITANIKDFRQVPNLQLLDPLGL